MIVQDFGGLDVFSLSGDFAQLPAVMGSPLYQRSYEAADVDKEGSSSSEYDDDDRRPSRRAKRNRKPLKQKPHAMENNLGLDRFHQSFDKAVILNESCRQAIHHDSPEKEETDHFFNGFLSSERKGEMTKDQEDRFNDMTLIDPTSQEYKDHWENVLHVFPHVASVAKHNTTMLFHHFDVNEVFDASPIFTENTLPVLTTDALAVIGKKSRAEYELKLANGAPVLVTMNQIPAKWNVVNGTVGTVVGWIASNTRHPSAILVHIEDAKCDIPDMTVDDGHGGKRTFHRVFAVEREYASISFKDDKRRKRKFGTFYFPVMLSYACTIHKVQGMTIEEIVVDVKEAWSALMIYVALSRVRNIKNIKMLSPLDRRIINAFKGSDEEKKIRKEIEIYKNNMKSLISDLVSSGWLPDDYLGMLSEIEGYDV